MAALDYVKIHWMGAPVFVGEVTFAPSRHDFDARRGGKIGKCGLKDHVTEHREDVASFEVEVTAAQLGAPSANRAKEA